MRPHSWRALAVVVALLLPSASAPAVAQDQRLEGRPTFTLDAGTASIRYDSAPGWNAATLGSALRLERERLRLRAEGALAFNGFGWSRQVGVSGSYLAPVTPTLHGEVAALAEGGRHGGVYRSTGQMLAQARAHWIVGDRGAWVGAGAGRAWNEETRPVLATADAGVWVRRGRITLSALASRTQFRDVVGNGWERYAWGPDLDRHADSMPVPVFGRRSAADVAAQLRWERGVLELDLSLGRRFETGAELDGAWGGAAAAVRLSKQFALVAAAGRYPGDFAQRLPRSRYATLALRVMPWSSVRTTAPSTPSAPPPFEVRDAGDGQRTLVVRTPGAARVEIMGSFTDWQPLAMARGSGDDWTVTVAIPPGTHHVNVRVDGGEWRAPPGLTAATDEFLGMVGVLVIK